jgi:hypothetical protein
MCSALRPPSPVVAEQCVSRAWLGLSVHRRARWGLSKTAAAFHLQSLQHPGALEERLSDERRSCLRPEEGPRGHPDVANQDYYGGGSGRLIRRRDEIAGRKIRPVHAERVRAEPCCSSPH